MSKYVFSVSLSPKEAMEKIKYEQNAELVHEDLFALGEDKYICILVFEKYYFRVENRAALTVIIDNTTGKTRVKSIASGSSKGIIFNFDWGAGDSFARSICNILAKYKI